MVVDNVDLRVSGADVLTSTLIYQILFIFQIGFLIRKRISEIDVVFRITIFDAVLVSIIGFWLCFQSKWRHFLW